MNTKRFIHPLIFWFGIIVLLLLMYPMVHPAAPLIKNVHAQQRPGTRLVDITYDVSDPEGAPLNISVVASSDSGKTYNIIPKTLTGDVGKGITTGTGKRIVWDIGKDLPNTRSNSFRVRILADDSEAAEDMVLIPAGEFPMGSNDGNFDEKPVHTVYLDAFYIDKYEVTNAQYKNFMDATGHSAPYYRNDKDYNAPDQPVVGVTWSDAEAYAKWAGKRLPTEAEWEKAARGGLTGKKHVWGDEWPPPKSAGNFDDEKVVDTYVIEGYSDGYVYTAPVGKFTPNGYGLYDMSGNVWEWCADWYDSSYYGNSPKSNPTGPGSGSYRVLRGGSWFSGLANYLRVSYRYDAGPTLTYNDIGFRCSGNFVSP